MATRVVQTILRNPKTGSVLCGHKTTVRLNTPSFDGSHVEVIRSSTVTSALSTDPTPGLLQVELSPNTGDATDPDIILKPADTYYSWNVASGITWYFQLPTGDHSAVLELDDYLIVGPVNPTPIQAGVSEAELDQRLSTYVPLSVVQSPVTASGNLVVSAHNPLDCTAGSRSFTLPTGVAKMTLSVERIDKVPGNSCTITGNIRGVPASSITLLSPSSVTASHESVLFLADASGSWWPIAGHKTKTWLDALYALGVDFDSALVLHTAAGAATRIRRERFGALEGAAYGVYGDSFAASTGNNWLRWWERVVARMGLGSLVINGAVAGTTFYNNSMAAAGGSRGWVPGAQAAILVSCGVNDAKYGNTAGNVFGMPHAVRALLSAFTARVAVAASTANFVYTGTSWVTEANVLSTSGTRWKTTHAGDSFTVNYTDEGYGCDLVFVARTSGAGLYSVTVDGVADGTLDLTTAVPEEGHAIYRVRGKAAGPHTVIVTFTSGISMVLDAYRIPSPEPVNGLLLGQGSRDSSRAPVTIPGTQPDVNIVLATITKPAIATVVAEFPTFLFADIDPVSGSGWNPVTMTRDGLHPNDRGASLVAEVVETAAQAFAYVPGTNFTSTLDVLPAYVFPTLAKIPVGSFDGTGGSGVLTTGSSTQILVDWSRIVPPSGITDWSIQYRTDPAGSVTTVTAGSGAATSKAITGLTNGVLYDFRVAPVTGAGVGTYSPYVTGTPFQLLSSTDFTIRANGSPGNDDQGQPLLVLDGGSGAAWMVTSGAVGCTAGTSSTDLVRDVGVADVRVKATLKTVPSLFIGGLVARAVDANNNYSVVMKNSTPAFFYAIYKRTAGTPAQLATSTVAPTAGDVVILVVKGSAISVIVNGVTAVSTTDTTYATGTKHGIYANFAAGGTTGAWSNMEIDAS